MEKPGYQKTLTYISLNYHLGGAIIVDVSFLPVLQEKAEHSNT